MNDKELKPYFVIYGLVCILVTVLILWVNDRSDYEEGLYKVKQEAESAYVSEEKEDAIQKTQKKEEVKVTYPDTVYGETRIIIYEKCPSCHGSGKISTTDSIVINNRKIPFSFSQSCKLCMFGSKLGMEEHVPTRNGAIVTKVIYN